MRKHVLYLLAVIALHIFFANTAFAKGEYLKKGFFDPPQSGDQVYKEDADKGFGWVGDQKCLLCHVDYAPNPPYKDWDWKDKYSLNANGKFFMSSGYQRLMVPGNTPLATFLPTQTIRLKLKNHDEGGVKFGRGSVDQEGDSYVIQWFELEKDGNPNPWGLTPGYTYKDFKLKEMWMKYNPATGKGDHWGKFEMKVEFQVVVNGKTEKREVKFDGQFMGYNTDAGGQTLKGTLWTTGLGKDSFLPDDSYYNSTNFVQKTMKALSAEYSIQMQNPWLMNHPSEPVLVLTPDNKATMTVTSATWSIEYRKLWDGHNGSNFHRNFAADTMKCAICHSTHRAAGDKMMNRKTEMMLCTSCHDGTGSAYNVLAGMVAGAYDSAAGPIDKWVSQTPGPNGKTFEVDKVTSRHDMRYTTLISAAPGGLEQWSGELRCTSCHNPHGNANHRSLRSTPNPYNWSQYGGENKIVVKAQVINARSSAANPETVRYLSGVTEFCSSCHVDYQAGMGAGSTGYYGNPMFGGKAMDSDMYGRRRHAMYVDGNDNPRHPFSGGERVAVGSASYPLKFEAEQVVPSEFGGGQKDAPAMMCLTCHFAHGTTVPETNSEGTGDYYKRGLGSTKILRAPGRGVCLACHNVNESL